VGKEEGKAHIKTIGATQRRGPDENKTSGGKEPLQKKRKGGDRGSQKKTRKKEKEIPVGGRKKKTCPHRELTKRRQRNGLF